MLYPIGRLQLMYFRLSEKSLYWK